MQSMSIQYLADEFIVISKQSNIPKLVEYMKIYIFSNTWKEYFYCLFYYVNKMLIDPERYEGYTRLIRFLKTVSMIFYKIRKLPTIDFSYLLFMNTTLDLAQYLICPFPIFHHIWF